MTWSSNKTWTANAVLPAADLNTYLRDQLNASPNAIVTTAGDQLFVTGANTFVRTPGSPYKTADESVNNNTTLQNDDHLFFAIGASEVWEFAMVLYWTIASGNPGYKYAFTVPVSCTGFYARDDYLGAIDTELSNTSIERRYSATLTTSVGVGLSGVTANMTQFRGVITNSTNAGTVQFQWAQNSAVASNLTIKLGSYMDLKRLG